MRILDLEARKMNKQRREKIRQLKTQIDIVQNREYIIRKYSEREINQIEVTGSQPVTYGSEWKIISNESKFSCGMKGVSNMNDVLEQRLAAKKRDLGNQQEYFRIDMKNIEQSNYEDNAINALLNMKKLKTEIAELELILQLQKANEL